MGLSDQIVESKSKVCKYSGHVCNKTNLWNVAEMIGMWRCPHVCCRLCDDGNKNRCGVRCNGVFEGR